MELCEFIKNKGYEQFKTNLLSWYPKLSDQEVLKHWRKAIKKPKRTTLRDLFGSEINDILKEELEGL